jgi:RNA polymerase sigma-70 factor (ECF subfamily)
MQPDPDAELMLRLKGGEDAALDALMARWQAPLARHLYRHLGNQAEALDLAQETFVRLYEARARYQPDRKFSTWLFAIAMNLCRNLLRWRSRHPVVPLDEAGGDEGVPWEVPMAENLQPSPADELARRELVQAVREAVLGLPEALRAPLLLAEYEGMSHREIAEVLNCSEKAVETRLYRARRELRERLVERGSVG